MESPLQHTEGSFDIPLTPYFDGPHILYGVHEFMSLHFMVVKGQEDGGLLPSGCEQHEVLQVGSIQEGILQALH